MDRPTQDTTAIQSKNQEDADTCRICRGEGSNNEPLFHPCKCSGSIMYVHQECLMTWLSHSQKKHCELCKTNFRFTKLYSPHMPNELPTQIFFKRASLHVLATLTYWLRGAFVAVTWLVWLPWSMRFAWWALLWIADGGWAADSLIPIPIRRAPRPQDPRPSQMSFSIFHALNMTADPITWRHTFTQNIWNIVKTSITHGLDVSLSRNTTQSGNATIIIANNATKAMGSRDTLLSDLQWLSNLTSSPAFNSFVMDVLEGQVITLSILVAVVLVFLIREWVVQQQPAVNWAPANEALQAMNEQQAGHNHNLEQDVDVPEDADHANNPPDDSELANNDELELPPPIFSDQDGALLEGVEDDPPLWLAEEEAVKSLLNDLERFHLELEQLAEPNEIPTGASRPRKIAQDLVMHIYTTTVALGKACELAWAESDFEALQGLHDRLGRLQVGLEYLGDLPERQRLVARVGPTLRWVERLLERGRQRSGSHLPVPAAQNLNASLASSASNNQIANPDSLSDRRPQVSDVEGRAMGLPADDVTTAESSTGPARPNMPVRSESFLATQIQRTLQESSSGGPVPLDPDTANGQHPIPSSSAQGPSFANDSDHSGDTESTESFSLLDSDVIGPGRSRAADTEEFQASQHDPLFEQAHVGADPIADMANGEDQGQNPATASDTNSQVQEVNITQESDNNSPRTLSDFLCDWMWGDLPVEAADVPPRAGDEHPRDDGDNQQMQFVEIAQEEPEDDAEGFDDAGPDQVRDNLQEVMAEMQRLNGLDADIANEDIEDLEGLLELIGMQGNILGLFQNAVFMAVVGSAAITTAVWFPYLWGKLVLIFIANPLQVALRTPLELLSGMANFAIDVTVWICSSLLLWIDASTQLLWRSGLWLASSTYTPGTSTIGEYSRRAADDAFARISRLFMSHSDYMHLSASSHASLRMLQTMVAEAMHFSRSICVATYRHSTKNGLFSVESLQLLVQTSHDIALQLQSFFQSWIRRISLPTSIDWSSAMNVQIRSSSSLTPLDPTLAVWSGTDRTLAVLAGYGFFIVLGAVYLTRLAPITASRQAKKVEEKVIDLLQQAGGIMKVIIIISIEMLVFPVYCGALLDIATLPLFDSISIEDRVVWTVACPWTSAFAHWFVGTCYMFHVALFVSMCRRIFRPGVIWFIRDPDDPTFHPVRDVLERNLTSQLRKITFSAAVYGGLVSFFMGSVVWTLAMTNTGILPIRWSSSAGIKGFPIDLLLYTSMKPIVVKLWSPSSGLHALYEWWFGRFAAYLRLRNFLLDGNAEADQRPTFTVGNDADASSNIDGRFVRVPNSDQARIPRGHSVFLEVDADNNRIDGREDLDEGVHGRRSVNFAKVYVPPFFRLRIFLFLVCLWVLTAAIGLALTVIPLVTGRLIFSGVLPQNTHVNDMYSFALGLCPIAAGLFLEPRIRDALAFMKAHLPSVQNLPLLINGTRRTILQGAQVLYTYSALLLVLPSLLVLVLEFYVVNPAHAYYAGPREIRAIHILQGWTLGVQYMRIIKHFIEWNADSRPARALRAVLERGWLNPNAGLATRAFIVPIAVSSIVALLMPLPIGWVASRLLHGPEEMEKRIQVMRFTYPAVLVVALAVWAGVLLLGALETWRLRIRDEVYLIGERLHNFGEKKPPTFAHSSATRINRS